VSEREREKSEEEKIEGREGSKGEEKIPLVGGVHVAPSTVRVRGLEPYTE
jgi:hypothetical protein